MKSLPIVDRGTGQLSETAQAAGGLPELQTEDLPALLTLFYATIALDPHLAPYFAAIDMAEHIPRIADFWSTLLFHTKRYSGNAFRPHASMPGLSAEHFARWVNALETVVDASFTGRAAEEMKALGARIAYSMQVRLGLEPFAGYPGILDA